MPYTIRKERDLEKIDIKSALHLLPVHPADRHSLDDKMERQCLHLRVYPLWPLLSSETI